MFSSYDFASDIISINVNCINCGIDAINEESCSEIIKLIRRYSSIKDDATIAPPFSPFTAGFHQYGYKDATEPKDLDSEIAKKMRLLVFLMKTPETISCGAPLAGTGYSVNH